MNIELRKNEGNIWVFRRDDGEQVNVYATDENGERVPIIERHARLFAGDAAMNKPKRPKPKPKPRPKPRPY